MSFYQTRKLFTVPVIVVIEKALGKDFPKPSVVLALALITAGVAFSTGANFDTNAVGVFVGLGSTVTTAMVVVSTTWLQKLHELSSSQLLHNVAIVDGVILTTFGPILDYQISDRILNIDYTWTKQAKVVFALTCGAAVLVNCVTFYLLGKIFSSVVPSHRTSENIDHLRHRILLFRQGGVSALKSWRGDDIFWLHHLRVNALQNDVSKGGFDVVVKNTATSVPDRRRIDYRMFSPFNICVRSVLSLFSSNVVNLRHVRSGVQTGSGVDPFSAFRVTHTDAYPHQNRLSVSFLLHSHHLKRVQSHFLWQLSRATNVESRFSSVP